MEKTDKEISLKQGLLSLSPIAVFLAMYLVVSIIVGDFYSMPLSVAFIAASVWAVATDRHRPLADRIDTFSRAAGRHNIIYMIWIFILAGAFASLAKETGSIEATVNITLRLLPPQMLLPGLFVAACFISLSIGTSVGTVVAIVPLAVDIAAKGGGDTAVLVAAVIGGAFFGDNLSFISDTTIAATRSQGVAMNAKFKANLLTVLPAAIATLILYAFIGQNTAEIAIGENANFFLALPYLLIIILSLAGMSVTIVLLSGILLSILIAVCNGFNIMSLFQFMGSGIDSMGDLIIITLLSAGMLGTIKETCGIEFLLNRMTRHINGAKGAKGVIAVLVGSVNICTANNTVAIITVGSIARRIAERYGISGARTASLLDTCSCIMQCLIPYGAQTLLATGLAGISPAAPWQYLYYPWALTAAVVIAILATKNKQNNNEFHR